MSNKSNRGRRGGGEGEAKGDGARGKTCCEKSGFDGSESLKNVLHTYIHIKKLKNQIKIV